MPTDEELTFADHAGRFYARRYGMAPMVGRLLGYLAVCDPREQSITELADACWQAGARSPAPSTRWRAWGSSGGPGPRATGWTGCASTCRRSARWVSISPSTRSRAELAREGLRLLAGAAPDRRAIVLEWAAFADFLVDRLPVMEQEWKERREKLRAAGELPPAPTPHRESRTR